MEIVVRKYIIGLCWLYIWILYIFMLPWYIIQNMSFISEKVAIAPCFDWATIKYLQMHAHASAMFNGCSEPLEHNSFQTVPCMQSRFLTTTSLSHFHNTTTQRDKTTNIVNTRKPNTPQVAHFLSLQLSASQFYHNEKRRSSGSSRSKDRNHNISVVLFAMFFHDACGEQASDDAIQGSCCSKSYAAWIMFCFRVGNWRHGGKNRPDQIGVCPTLCHLRVCVCSRYLCKHASTGSLQRWDYYCISCVHTFLCGSSRIPVYGPRTSQQEIHGSDGNRCIRSIRLCVTWRRIFHGRDGSVLLGVRVVLSPLFSDDVWKSLASKCKAGDRMGTSALHKSFEVRLTLPPFKFLSIRGN